MQEALGHGCGPADKASSPYPPEAASPLCQLLGTIFCFASPASPPLSLCPLGVTDILRVPPYFFPPLMEGTSFPAEDISRPLGALLCF